MKVKIAYAITICCMLLCVIVLSVLAYNNVVYGLGTKIFMLVLNSLAICFGFGTALFIYLDDIDER